MRARRWIGGLAVMMGSFATAAHAVDASAGPAPAAVHAQVSGTGVNGHAAGLPTSVQPLRAVTGAGADGLDPGSHSVPWRAGSVNALPSRRPLDINAAMNAAPPRSTADYFLLGLVGIALVVYQLLRKHRQLRPQTFSL